jgi:hypothetical protein
MNKVDNIDGGREMDDGAGSAADLAVRLAAAGATSVDVRALGVDVRAGLSLAERLERLLDRDVEDGRDTAEARRRGE